MELYWNRGLPGIGFVVLSKQTTFWRAEAGFWNRTGGLSYRAYRAPEELKDKFGVDARELVLESAREWCNLKAWEVEPRFAPLLTFESTPLNRDRIITALLSSAFHWPAFLDECEANFKEAEFLDRCRKLKEPAKGLRENQE